MDDVLRDTVIGSRYLLIDPVADGLDDASTWAAEDQILGRAVRLSLVRGPRAALALDESRRAALVHGPGFLRVLDAGTSPEGDYVVTEAPRGRSLATLVAAGPLSGEQARAVIGQAATALESAARLGVHHLALRPESLLVDGTRVAVAGLGLDGVLHPSAVSPGDDAVHPDLRALAALLHLALTGAEPEPGAAFVSPGTLVAGVPHDLDDLCAQLLGDGSPQDSAPRSLTALTTRLAPWDPEALLSLPRDPDGAAAEGAAGRDGAPEASGDAAPVTPPRVSRQSVRAILDAPENSGPVRPGTPPPARPHHTLNRVSVAARSAPALGAGSGAGAGVGASGAAAAGEGGVGGAAAARPERGVSAQAAPAGGWPATGSGSVPAHGPVGGAGSARGARSAGDPGPTEGRAAALQEAARTVRFNPTRLVLVLFGAGVVVALLLAINGLTHGISLDFGRDDRVEVPAAGGGSTAPDGGADDGPDQETGAPPRIASGLQLDPEGDGNEHPEAVDRAYDQDPASFWFSRTYRSPQYGGLKAGIGYAITLEAPATVSAVYLSTNNTGGRVEVRVGDGSSPTSGEVLASAPLEAETVLTLSAPTDTDGLVLWFPELPAAADGGLRLEIRDIFLS